LYFLLKAGPPPPPGGFWKKLEVIPWIFNHVHPSLYRRNKVGGKNLNGAEIK
jgi:hypothetical protein